MNYDGNNANNADNIKIENAIFNMYAYQVFDEFIGVNPQTGAAKINEDVKSL